MLSKILFMPSDLPHGCNREFTQQDAPADDAPKKSRNERSHKLLASQLVNINFATQDFKKRVLVRTLKFFE